jgi:hypothetical protein
LPDAGPKAFSRSLLSGSNVTKAVSVELRMEVGEKSFDYPDQVAVSTLPGIVIALPGN